MNSDTDSLVPANLAAQLCEAHETETSAPNGWQSAVMPSVSEVSQILETLRDILFPGIASGLRPKGAELRGFVESRIHEVAFRLRRQICFGERYGKRAHDLSAECAECRDCADRTTRAFLGQLPAIRAALGRDAEAAMAGDPAARDLGEVILSYPGHYAVTVYRIAHALWTLGAPFVPRMMTEHAHRTTSIDIHPGATIGQSFFIDHGTGVVIGETTVIGDHVRLYQGVTLGALSLSSSRVRELRSGPKRHPTLEDHVIVYAGATILGGDTVIGRGSVIGGNCWIVTSVPPGSRVSVPVQSEVRLPAAENASPAANATTQAKAIDT